MRLTAICDAATRFPAIGLPQAMRAGLPSTRTGRIKPCTHITRPLKD